MEIGSPAGVMHGCRFAEVKIKRQGQKLLDFPGRMGLTAVI
jgi:hypothetical protein